MVCKPWSSKQIISVGLKCGPHRTHSEPEEICWLCEGQPVRTIRGKISFMLHQHDVVLMLKVRMSGSCTVSRLSSLAAVQHHLKMQIWTTPDTGQSYKNRQDYNQRIINVRTSVWRLLSWWTVRETPPAFGTPTQAHLYLALMEWLFKTNTN